MSRERGNRKTTQATTSIRISSHPTSLSEEPSKELGGAGLDWTGLDWTGLRKLHVEHVENQDLSVKKTIVTSFWTQKSHL